MLGAVLHALRDRVPGPLAAHLGAQLPLMVRGAYYDGYQAKAEPPERRDGEAFLAEVGEGLRDTRPVNARDAACAVFDVLSAHLPRGQCAKVRDALPDDVKALWRLDNGDRPSIEEHAAAGRAAAKSVGSREPTAAGRKSPRRT